MLWISLCASRSISSCGISASFKDTHTHTHTAGQRAAPRGSPRPGDGHGVSKRTWGTAGHVWTERGKDSPPAPPTAGAHPRGCATAQPGTSARLGSVLPGSVPAGAAPLLPEPPEPAGSPPAEPPAEVCPNGLKVRGGPGSPGAGRATAAPGPGKVGAAPQRRPARTPRPKAPVAKPGTRPRRAAPPASAPGPRSARGPHPTPARAPLVPFPQRCRCRGGCALRCAPRGRPLPGGSAPALFANNRSPFVPGGRESLYYICYKHVGTYIHLYYFFQAQQAAPKRNARSFPSPMARAKWQLAFCLAGLGLGQGGCLQPGRGAGMPAGPRWAQPQPFPAPSPGCGVPRAPRTRRSARTYLAGGKGQVAKTYQQNASPGPHRGLVHFRYGGKATLMERSCRPAPAAQKFSTIPQGKGSGVASGVLRIQGGSGLPRGGGAGITALPLFVRSSPTGARPLSFLPLSLAPLGS